MLAKLWDSNDMGKRRFPAQRSWQNILNGQAVMPRADRYTGWQIKESVACWGDLSKVWGGLFSSHYRYLQSLQSDGRNSEQGVSTNLNLNVSLAVPSRR